MPPNPLCCRCANSCCGCAVSYTHLDVYKRQLLLAAPAGARTTLGLDPGLRTGVKVAVVDATGKLIDTATIYPLSLIHIFFPYCSA